MLMHYLTTALRTFRRHRFSTTINIAVMSLVGMAVDATGRRLREIGIRKTLGASAIEIGLMLLRDFSKPVLIGNLIAWPVAYLAGQAYANLFTQRAPGSLVPFALSLLATLIIAWVAVAAQSVRAARVTPTAVLRQE
ncbi:MAG: FtsX-like permease family protein [Steroidobacteraceae bacterium]